MNKIKDFLDELQQEPSPIEKLAEGLKTAEAVPATEDLEGLVNIIDDRINIKLAELEKVAVGVVGPTADPQAVPGNPALQLSRELGPEQQQTNATISQLIDQLTNGGRMAGPNGYIATPAGIIGPATARGQEPPIAAEAEMVSEVNDTSKAAMEAVVGEVYSRFFGGGE